MLVWRWSSLGMLALLFAFGCAGEQRKTDTSVRVWREPEPEPELTPASRFDPNLGAPAESSAVKEPITDRKLPDQFVATGLTDEQIAAVLDMMHEMEIRAARIALHKAQDARVRAYAGKLLAEHLAAEKALAKLGLHESGSLLASELNTNAQAIAQSLQTATKAEFDRVYIDSQVTGHEQAIATIDADLTPAVEASQLKNLLESTRPLLEKHLDEARELQAQL